MVENMKIESVGVKKSGMKDGVSLRGKDDGVSLRGKNVGLSAGDQRMNESRKRKNVGLRNSGFCVKKKRKKEVPKVEKEVEKKVIVDDGVELGDKYVSVKESSFSFDEKFTIPVNETSCISMDMHDNLLLVGGTKSVVKVYDFDEMDLHLRPKREWNEDEVEQKINQISFNPSGSLICLVPDLPRPYILRGDTYFIKQLKMGNHYIYDQSRTAGHTGSVQYVAWDPEDENRLYSAANDGTVRYWSCNEKSKDNLDVWKIRFQRRKITPATCLDIKDKIMGVGLKTGTIQFFDLKENKKQPYVDWNNPIQSPVTCMKFHGNHLISRTKQSLLIFDVRKMTNPIKNYHIPHNSDQAQFKVYQNNILLGTNHGALISVNIDELRVVEQIQMLPTDTAIIQLYYRDDWNQLYLCTNKGNVEVFYHHELSLNGIKSVIKRGKPQIRIEDGMTNISEEAYMEVQYKEQPKPEKIPPLGPGRSGKTGVSIQTLTLKGISQNPDG